MNGPGRPHAATPVTPPSPTRSSPGAPGPQASKSPRARRLAVVEDHVLMGDALGRMAEASEDFILAGRARSSDEALANWQQWSPEVALVDVQLPGSVNGLELARRLLEDDSSLVVVFYSGTTDEAIVTAAIEVGARGFLSKEVEPRELLPSLRRACEGELAFDRVTASLVVAGMRAGDPSSNDDTGPGLTRREVEVLELVAKGKTNVQIAHDMGVSAATVKTLLARARVKLDAPDRASAVSRAIRLDVISAV